MGYQFARDLRVYLPEHEALTQHLLYNHFPPISLIFLAVVREALQFARNGDYAKKLDLPTGRRLSVRDIVEQLHLETFLGEVQS